MKKIILIKRSEKPIGYLKLVMVFGLGFSALITLTACNTGDDRELPAGTEISINPSNVSLNVAQVMTDEQCIGGRYEDYYTTISVTGGNGTPLGEADLTFSLDFSENTSTTGVMQLYADYNGNGVVDEATELVSGEGQPLYQTSTDEFSGTAVVIVRLYVSCSYKGYLRVSSDGFFTEAVYEIIYDDTADTDGTDNEAT